MALTFNLPSQIVVQTAAQWAADNTVYSNKRILVTSDVYYGGTDQRKFKIADGVQTWTNLDYMPIAQTLAQVLANGSNTNSVSLKSNDNLTEFLVANNNIDAYVDNGSDVSEINITPTTISISTTGASIDLSAASVTKNSDEILTSANITQTITNGVTDKAPSQDAVFDALALKTDKGYTLIGGTSATTPADSTTYFFGGVQSQGLLSAENVTTKIPVPKTGTIKSVQLSFLAGGTNEVSTISLRLNGTTDYTVSATSDMTSGLIANYGLSIAVTQGDTFCFKWLTPAWVTNPANLRFHIVVYIE
jgi:hypothetical protein